MTTVEGHPHPQNLGNSLYAKPVQDKGGHIKGTKFGKTGHYDENEEHRKLGKAAAQSYSMKHCRHWALNTCSRGSKGCSFAHDKDRWGTEMPPEAFRFIYAMDPNMEQDFLSCEYFQGPNMTNYDPNLPARSNQGKGKPGKSDDKGKKSMVPIGTIFEALIIATKILLGTQMSIVLGAP